MSNKNKTLAKNPKKKNDETPSSFLNIDYYKLLSDELNLKLNGLKEENEKLKFVISKYEEIQKASLNDKKDIIEYLGKELQNKEDEISDLKDRLIHLNTSNKNNRLEFELKIKENENLYKDKLEKLTNENLLLSSKLSTVENFINEKSLLEQKLSEHVDTIEKLKAHNKDSVYELEKGFLIEKTKLRSEMIEKLNELANEFRNAFHQQMNNTTKKIIRENYSLNLDIKKLAQTSDKLLDENQSLKEMNLKNRLELEINEKINNELSKKFLTSIKTIQMLCEKESLDEDIDKIIEKNSNEIKNLRQENLDLKQEINTMQKDLMNIEQNNGKEKNLICECKNDIDMLNMSKKRFTTIMKHTSDVMFKNLQQICPENDREIFKMYLADLAEIINRVQLINFKI